MGQLRVAQPAPYGRAPREYGVPVGTGLAPRANLEVAFERVLP